MPDYLSNALTAAISAVLGAVVGLFGGVWVEHRRSRRDDRLTHAREIRAAVLDPLALRIESYCLPICEGRARPIELEGVRQSDAFAEMSNRDREWQDRFVPLRPVGLPRPTKERGKWALDLRDRSHEKIDRVLVEHARAHLPTLIGAWEVAELDLVSWQHEVINHGDRIFQTLTSQTGLAAVRGFSGPRGVMKEFALWVVDRQLGIADTSLYLNRAPQPGMYEASVWDGYGQYFAFGSVSEMESCKATALTLLDDHSTRDVLLGRRARLTTGLREFHAQVRLAASKTVLPGRCSIV